MNHESTSVEGPLAALVERFGLSPKTLPTLTLLVELLAQDPHAPTSVREPREIIDRHLADSLVALELDPVRRARLALDLGSGGGIPGLPLAVALPETEFVLLESATRKCEFLERTVASLGLRNAMVVHDRAETYEAGLGRHDLVTVRAVASLEVAAEYAAPLLRTGGTLVAWSGRRSNDAEAAARRAASELGLGELSVRQVDPFPGAEYRHLYLMSKVMETPSRFPRRPGVARKRPLGASSAGPGPSDRSPR